MQISQNRLVFIGQSRGVVVSYLHGTSEVTLTVVTGAAIIFCFCNKE